jgi:hypothetical protein
MASQCKGGQELKNKPLNTTKATSQTPQKIIVCCYVAIIVQR